MIMGRRVRRVLSEDIINGAKVAKHSLTANTTTKPKVALQQTYLQAIAFAIIDV